MISDLYRWSTVGEINQAVLVAVTQIPRYSLPSTDQKVTYHTSYSYGRSTKSFLFHYIDPKVRSVTETFGYTTGPTPGDPESQGATSTDAAERLSLSLAYHPVILRSTPFDVNEVSNLLQPATLDDQQLLEYFFSEQDPSEDQLRLHTSLQEDRSWSPDLPVTGWNVNNGLTDELMYHLHEFCATLPAGHPECSPNYNPTQGLGLISPPNISKFVNLYFHHWNRHSPVIHRGTFNPGKATLPLLLVIILTGALFSSQDDAAKASVLISLVEEFAFRNEMFERLLTGKAPDGRDQERMSQDALQAAFSVAQLQLREGSASIRKRTRSTRFGQIITAARTVGLMKARNEFFTHDTDRFDWDRFSYSEARIRLICGLFALDTSFMIFYNMTPRISVEELGIDMPCSLESYLANNTEICHRAARAELGSHLPQLSDIIAIYLGRQPKPDTFLDKKSFSILDFYVVIVALLHKIWTLPLHEVCLPEEPTRSALSRWRNNWDTHVARITSQQSELSGFTKQAAIEFWHLSDIIRTQSSRALPA